jgi:hypothetical protein
VLSTSGCKKREPVGSPLDPALDRLVSPDVKMLAVIQLDELRKTPLFQRHQNELDFPLLQGMTKQFGFDPVRDLTQAIVTWDGKEAVVIGSGRFTQTEVERHLSMTSQPANYKGIRIFGNPASSLALLDGRTLVVAKLNAVERTIDKAQGQRGSLPEELALVFAAVPAAAQIRAASVGGLPLADMPLNADVESALSNLAGYVKTTGIGLAISSGLQLDGDLTCVSEQGARRVRDAFRGGIGFARLSTKGDAMDLLRLWDAVLVDQNNDRVRVKAELPGDLADELLARALGNGLGRLRPRT